MRRLPDRIRPGVRVLFVGINTGLRSAAIGHHFAGYSNRFWKLLCDSGLVPPPLTCEDDVRLPSGATTSRIWLRGPAPAWTNWGPANFGPAVAGSSPRSDGFVRKWRRSSA